MPEARSPPLRLPLVFTPAKWRFLSGAPPGGFSAFNSRRGRCDALSVLSIDLQFLARQICYSRMALSPLRCDGSFTSWTYCGVDLVPFDIEFKSALRHFMAACSCSVLRSLSSSCVFYPFQMYVYISLRFGSTPRAFLRRPILLVP